MAGCHHDNQALEADLIIEVAREGDILEVGEDLKDIECEKNPGHQDFIPFKDLTLEHLPNEHRNREMFDSIKQMGNRVVRLVVDKKKLGTGCVIKYGDDYLIQTNNHVVETDDEVINCTVDFHYDDDNRSSEVIIRGVELILSCPYRDITSFTFRPVPDFIHQLDWKEEFLSPSIVIMYKNNHIKTGITCMYKHTPLQYYSIDNLNSPLNYLMFISHPDGSISYLKSSYFKFQPITSNIQQLTSIEVHIDEDDGNSRVIPGDVVKFDDEFVVKISESIIQDEVKKCRLVLNGEVIGRGTRLYFQLVDVREYYSGIELENLIKLGTENLWIFEIYPIPRYMKDILQSRPSRNMCCIGHPHGGIKMITFGQYLGKYEERFDTNYDYILKPKPDCQYKTVKCIKYSCRTCKGSSGSPVFRLQGKTNIMKSDTHFMGFRVKRHLFNDEWIENVNMAWCPHKK